MAVDGTTYSIKRCRSARSTCENCHACSDQSFTGHLSAIRYKYALVWANLPDSSSFHPLHPCETNLGTLTRQDWVWGKGLMHADSNKVTFALYQGRSGKEWKRVRTIALHNAEAWERRDQNKTCCPRRRCRPARNSPIQRLVFWAISCLGFVAVSRRCELAREAQDASVL